MNINEKFYKKGMKIMNIGDSYNTNVLIMRIDEDKLSSVVSIKKKHPRIKRAITEKGIYIFAEYMKPIDDKDFCYRVSIGIGDVEPDRFAIGFIEVSKINCKKELLEWLYSDNFVNYVCKLMLNNYAKLHLQMPVPCEDVEKTKYVSNYEEKIDINYISEAMCHSIIGKLWNYARFRDGKKENRDKLVKDIGLTDNEFHVLIEFNTRGA